MKKVRPGDRLKISAADYNAFVDGARQRRDREHDRLAELTAAPPRASVIRVANTTSGAVALQRHDVVFVDQFAISPAANPNGWASEPVPRVFYQPVGVYDGARLLGSLEGYYRLCILLEPIPPGRIGRAVVSGVVQTKVEVTNETHEYATAASKQDPNLPQVPENVMRLRSSGFSGDPCKILWKEPGLGEKWATVRLGNARPTVGDYKTGLGLQEFGLIGGTPGPAVIYPDSSATGDYVCPVSPSLDVPNLGGHWVFRSEGVYRINWILNVYGGEAKNCKYELVKVSGVDETVIQLVYNSPPRNPAGSDGYADPTLLQVTVLAWHKFAAGDLFYLRCGVLSMHKLPPPYDVRLYWPTIQDSQLEVTMVGNHYPFRHSV